MVKQRVHGQKPRKKNKDKGPKQSPEAAAAAEAFASAGGSKLAKKKHLRGGLSGKQQLAARLRAEAGPGRSSEIAGGHGAEKRREGTYSHGCSVPSPENGRRSRS